MSVYIDKMGDTQTHLNLLLLHQLYKPNNLPGNIFIFELFGGVLDILRLVPILVLLALLVLAVSRSCSCYLCSFYKLSCLLMLVLSITELV